MEEMRLAIAMVDIYYESSTVALVVVAWVSEPGEDTISGRRGHLCIGEENGIFP